MRWRRGSHPNTAAGHQHHGCFLSTDTYAALQGECGLLRQGGARNSVHQGLEEKAGTVCSEDIGELQSWGNLELGAWRGGRQLESLVGKGFGLYHRAAKGKQTDRKTGRVEQGAGRAARRPARTRQTARPPCRWAPAGGGQQYRRSRALGTAKTVQLSLRLPVQPSPECSQDASLLGIPQPPSGREGLWAESSWRQWALQLIS